MDAQGLGSRSGRRHRGRRSEREWVTRRRRTMALLVLGFALAAAAALWLIALMIENV